MIRCATCVMPSSRPDTPFVETTCQACINFRNRVRVDYEARYRKLLDVLDRVNGKVAVASSGGKDSTYIALRLKDLGADVTAITATTCHLTPVGRRNIDNLARHVRTIEVTPCMDTRAKLNRLSLEMVGDPSWPEHVSIHRVPFRVANQLGMKAIFYGEAPTNQYGGPKGREDEQLMTQRWASEFGGFLGMRAQDFVGMDGITEVDMTDYLAPSDEELARNEVTAYFLGWFEPWDSQRNSVFARAHGMSVNAGDKPPCFANWWVAENLDNAQVCLHDDMMHSKFGYGRGCAQISVDVRSGLVQREYALDWVQKHDGVLDAYYMDVPLTEILARIGVSRHRYAEIRQKFACAGAPV